MRTAILAIAALIGASVVYGEDCGPTLAVAPRYPLLAFQARVSGRVQIEVEIGSDGKVVGLSRFEGDKIFQATSEEAARAWRFEEASSTNRKCILTMVYRIMPRGTSPQELTARFEPPLLVEVRRETAEPTVLVDPAPDRTKRRR
ncbi:MAG: TonB family protein [Bryobacteraceae bacterium]|jgi:TonB family protein